MLARWSVGIATKPGSSAPGLTAEPGVASQGSVNAHDAVANNSPSRVDCTGALSTEAVHLAVLIIESNVHSRQLCRGLHAVSTARVNLLHRVGGIGMNNALRSLYDTSLYDAAASVFCKGRVECKVTTCTSPAPKSHVAPYASGDSCALPKHTPRVRSICEGHL